MNKPTRELSREHIAHYVEQQSAAVLRRLLMEAFDRDNTLATQLVRKTLDSLAHRAPQGSDQVTN